MEVFRRPIESTQYVSEAFRTELAEHKMLASMSAKGDCYDNAVVESFFATLEFELFDEERLAYARGGAPRDLPVYRDLVQSETPAFRVGLYQSGGVPSAVAAGRVVPITYASTKSGEAHTSTAWRVSSPPVLAGTILRVHT